MLEMVRIKSNFPVQNGHCSRIGIVRELVPHLYAIEKELEFRMFFLNDGKLDK